MLSAQHYNLLFMPAKECGCLSMTSSDFIRQHHRLRPGQHHAPYSIGMHYVFLEGIICRKNFKTMFGELILLFGSIYNGLFCYKLLDK